MNAGTGKLISSQQKLKKRYASKSGAQLRLSEGGGGVPLRIQVRQACSQHPWDRVQGKECRKNFNYKTAWMNTIKLFDDFLTETM